VEVVKSNFEQALVAAKGPNRKEPVLVKVI
jgi:hypothetical protein